MPVRPTLRAGHNAGRREPARVAWSIMGAAHGRGKERSEIAGAAASVAERHSCCSVENPSPQPPPRSGEGEQAERRLFFSPSPLRGGGWGEGFSTEHTHDRKSCAVDTRGGKIIYTPEESVECVAGCSRPVPFLATVYSPGKATGILNNVNGLSPMSCFL